VDAATAKSAALLCQTGRQKKEIAEVNDRIRQLNQDVERGRLDQGILGSEVAAHRRARERAEKRLEATAHAVRLSGAMMDSSHAMRLLVDGQRRCSDRGRLAHCKMELDGKKTELEDRVEELRDVRRAKSGCAANRCPATCARFVRGLGGETLAAS
jgi:hypothetical protein